MSKSNGKNSKEAPRKLQRMSGYSYSVTIPKPLIDTLGWREGQKLQVTRKGKSVLITDWS